MKGSMTTNMNNGEWSTWAKYVLKSLEELKAHTTSQDSKIDANKDEYIRAINSLELAVTKKIGELSSEIKVMKSKTTRTSSFYAAIIALAPSLVYLIYNIIK